MEDSSSSEMVDRIKGNAQRVRELLSAAGISAYDYGMVISLESQRGNFFMDMIGSLPKEAVDALVGLATGVEIGYTFGYATISNSLPDEMQSRVNEFTDKVDAEFRSLSSRESN